MITTILVEHRWLTAMALTLLVVVGPVLGAWLAPRPRVTAVLLALSGVTVALLTLSPTSRDLSVGCYVEWSIPTLGAVELVANVVLFAPVVLLGGILVRRPWTALVVASLVSAAIEAFQAVVPSLGRSCSTNDWLSNTLGALLGAVLAATALWLARWVAARRAPRAAA